MLDKAAGDQGESQNDVTATASDVGHHSEGIESQSDETLAVADVGQTLDNPIGQQGEGVDSINMESVTNQALILSDPEIDADALEYLTLMLDK